MTLSGKASPQNVWECGVSVVSGFFDGGLGNDELTPALSAYQVLLLLVTGVVGVLAARQAVLRWRT